MKEFLSFIKKEFRHIFRDRRTILIVLVMPIVQIISTARNSLRFFPPFEKYATPMRVESIAHAIANAENEESLERRPAKSVSALSGT